MSITQSYKVFIGGSVLVVGNKADNQAVFNRKLTNPNQNDWAKLIFELETENQTVLVQGDLNQNWNWFCANYKLVEAAGGLVENEDGNWLFIYRNEMWDLPKGKLEKGEGIEKCAVREVAEECGIEEPEIVKSLSTTYHTYQLKDKRILKPTYWFLMKSSDKSQLEPQTEEGITEVKWVSTNEAKKLSESSFGSIKQVVTEGLN